MFGYDPRMNPAGDDRNSPDQRRRRWRERGRTLQHHDPLAPPPIHTILRHTPPLRPSPQVRIAGARELAQLAPYLLKERDSTFLIDASDAETGEPDEPDQQDQQRAAQRREDVETVLGGLRELAEQARSEHTKLSALYTLSLIQGHDALRPELLSFAAATHSERARLRAFHVLARGLGLIRSSAPAPTRSQPPRPRVRIVLIWAAGPDDRERYPHLFAGAPRTTSAAEKSPKPAAAAEPTPRLPTPATPTPLKLQSPFTASSAERNPQPNPAAPKPHAPVHHYAAPTHDPPPFAAQPLTPNQLETARLLEWSQEVIARRRRAPPIVIRR